MRNFGFALIVFLALPLPAIAQHSPALPSIGLPLPPIGLRPSWERPQTPWWERQAPPPWERGHVPRPVVDVRQHRPRLRSPQVIYVMQPYPVEVQQPPQVIVIQPVTSVVAPPAPEPPPPPPPSLHVPLDANPGPPPPYVPSGDRTLYVIPGCYVGNVPPANMKLPAGCDLSRLTTYTP
jgi:hypothetical protein